MQKDFPKIVTFEHQFSLTYTRLDFDTGEWVAINEIDPFYGHVSNTKCNMEYEDLFDILLISYVESEKRSLEDEYNLYYERNYDGYIQKFKRMKNGILALHGHDFEDEDTKDYFMPQVWYLPIKNKKVLVDELNPNERFYYDQIEEVLLRERQNDM